MTQQDPEVQALHDAFDATKITWHDRAATLAAFRAQAEIYKKEDGQLYSYFQGEEMPFHEALVKHAMGNRVEVDARTLPKNTVDSKENYVSVRAKVDFIQKHGEDAWSNLPTSSVVIPTVVQFQDDFRKLPLAEKARLLNEDPDYVAKLPARPNPNKVGETYINHELITKQKRICPSRG